MLNAKITGVGKCIPKKILDNAYFERIVDTSNEWIIQRTGIKERHVVTDEKHSDLATQAALIALDNSGLSADKIDRIIVATVKGDYSCPSCACLVQKNIQAHNAAAFDINAGCTGFIFGLDLASAYIKSGACRKILLIGVEVLSAVTDYTDRQTCVLFGDGAGAVVIEESHNESGILATNIFSDGNHSMLLYFEKMPNGREFLRMDGKEIFKYAVRGMIHASELVLEKAGLQKEQLDLIIPHQANARIIQSVAEKLRVDITFSKIFMNIERYGNMSSASIPIALTEALEEDKIQDRSLVLLTAFGAGLTWGSSLIRWGKVE